MTAPIFIIIDVAMARSGATDGATSYTDRATAQEWFNELAMDGKNVRILVWHGDEPTADLTSDAVELAALAYLDNCDDTSDIPQWVYASDGYDTWLKGRNSIAVQARREANHRRALMANR